jgi:uncharacterized protein (DUF58 family)
VLRALSSAQPGGRTDTAAGLASLPERLARRGLVVLIGDMLDDTARTVEVMKSFRLRGHELIVFQVLTPEERQFPYRENYEFVDAETGEKLSAQASYIATAYRKAFGEHMDVLKRFCRQSDVDFVELDTAESLATALVGFLNRRKGAR